MEVTAAEALAATTRVEEASAASGVLAEAIRVEAELQATGKTLWNVC